MIKDRLQALMNNPAVYKHLTPEEMEVLADARERILDLECELSDAYRQVARQGL